MLKLLSLSARSKDREIKVPLYTSYGVTHVWMLDLRVAIGVMESDGDVCCRGYNRRDVLRGLHISLGAIVGVKPN